MTNPYYHACIDCGQVLHELDTNAQGKDVLIFDDGGWFCRECWKEMDAKRDAIDARFNEAVMESMDRFAEMNDYEDQHSMRRMV